MVDQEALVIDAEPQAPHGPQARHPGSIGLGAGPGSGRRKGRGFPEAIKDGTCFASCWSSVGAAGSRSWAAGPSMVDHPGAAVQGDQWTSAQSLDGLLKTPPPLPLIRTRPWWFPVQELRDPLVFYLEAWLADLIFGERPGCAGGLVPSSPSPIPGPRWTP